jgi:uncharacterized protein YdiU (UPF0061 family)
MQNLSKKEFQQTFVSSFAGDHSGNLTPRQTPGVLYSKAIPTSVPSPKLLAWSEEMAFTLDLALPDSLDISILSGNHISSSMFPYAACYAGHQFGHWAGQLGDGRAITLGELKASNGTDYEIQLKGAGPTPYSRRADGRAVLRSSVREYLMSEAMFHLGVSTTRALGLVSTGEPVLRDMFYNGNAAYEPGAIVTRVAPTFLRFGNFEMLASRKDMVNLSSLVEWTINRFYSHITTNGEEKILQWFREVVERTAELIVAWQRVGFVHGVMNTDNMSILGLTIDYGPYSFIDHYDLNFTPNTTDLPGRRYAFGNQSSIAYWNLGCLANAIAPLLTNTDQLVKDLEGYVEIYWRKYYLMMGDKIGLDEIFEEDIDLIDQLEKMLSSIQPDMTLFYQLLIELPITINSLEEVVNFFKPSFYQELSKEHAQLLLDFIFAYLPRRKRSILSDEESKHKMQKANPRFILRNYLLHQAIEELEKGNDVLFLKLEKAMKDPYSTSHDEFFKKRPDWATSKAGCSMLSCSS